MFKFLSKIISQRIVSITTPLRSTDRGGAELLFHCINGYVKYDHSSGRWFIYDSIHWVVDEVNRINEIMLYIGRNYEEATLKKQGQVVKVLNQWENIGKAKKVLESLSSMNGVAIRGKELDSNPYLFCCKNGTFNFVNMDFKDNDPGNLITVCANFNYDPKMEPVNWLRFLDKIFGGDRELIDFIQMFIGISLTGTSSFDKLVFFYGNGKNGKSVLIKVIMLLLGKYAVKVPNRVVQREGNSNPGQIQNEIVRLKGTRLAIATESESGQPLSEATIKDMTGSDTLVGNAKYKDTIQFDPTHKLLLYGNHKPVISGTDNGIWRRIVMIPFRVTITDEEQVPSEILIEQLRSELPGIFNWAIQGFQNWLTWDKKLPKRVLNEVKDYRHESDHVLAFIDTCVVDSSSELKQDDLYQAYTKWCLNNETKPKTKALLTRDLKIRGWDSRTGGGRKTIWLYKSLVPTLI